MTVNPAPRQTSATLSRRGVILPAQLGEVDRFHAVVVDVPGPLELGAETAGDAEKQVLGAERPLHALDIAEAVLDREDQRLWPDHGPGVGQGAARCP